MERVRLGNTGRKGSRESHGIQAPDSYLYGDLRYRKLINCYKLRKDDYTLMCLNILLLKQRIINIFFYSNLL